MTVYVRTGNSGHVSDGAESLSKAVRSFTCFSNPFFIDRVYSRGLGFLGHDRAQVRPSGVSLFNSSNTR